MLTSRIWGGSIPEHKGGGRWGDLPADSSFEFDDADAEDEVLMVFQRLVYGGIDGFQGCNGIVVTPALAHDEC